VSLPERFSPVPYYLYCRSLELTLKAFLLAQGTPVAQLKKPSLGHDLMRLLAAAHKLDLAKVAKVGQPDRRLLSLANKYYKEKGFEYFRMLPAAFGYPDLPDLEHLASFSARLHAAVHVTCKASLHQDPPVVF
jgi:hypothetical protein